MTIGDVIRTHRKKANLTQEEMATRLGVTAPAVNKWEHNHTQPDISLLAPIARLLGITTDTLLSFQKELSRKEIRQYIAELDRQLDSQPYAEVFSLAKQQLERYPNCTELIWNIALILDSRRLTDQTPHAEIYDDAIESWYRRALVSEEETVRLAAAESLFHFYIRKELYDQAQQCLEYVSVQNPDKKSWQALIYQKTGKKEEACRLYEELLLLECNRMRMTITNLRLSYCQDDDHAMAHKLANLESELAKLFELGVYQESMAGLELAVWEKDAPETARLMKILLENIGTLNHFTKSSIFRHTQTNQMDAAYLGKLKEMLLRSFLDEDSYGYMAGNDFWESLKRRTQPQHPFGSTR